MKDPLCLFMKMPLVLEYKTALHTNRNTAVTNGFLPHSICEDTMESYQNHIKFVGLMGFELQLKIHH